MSDFSDLIKKQKELVSATQAAALENPTDRDASVAMATSIDKLATLVAHECPPAGRP